MDSTFSPFVTDSFTRLPWIRGGYTLSSIRTIIYPHHHLSAPSSIRTGALVTRLTPTPPDNRFEVLWWRRDAWGTTGPFGAVCSLDDAPDIIASKPPFWIRA